MSTKKREKHTNLNSNQKRGKEKNKRKKEKKKKIMKTILSKVSSIFITDSDSDSGSPISPPSPPSQGASTPPLATLDDKIRRQGSRTPTPHIEKISFEIKRTGKSLDLRRSTNKSIEYLAPNFE